MLVIRYFNKYFKKFIDITIDFDKAHILYKKIKRKHKYAEVIFIDKGVEHHIW